MPPKHKKRSKSDFWLGVLENTLAGIFAGTLMLLIAERWASKEITQVVTEVKKEEQEVHAVQTEVDQLNHNLEKLASKKK
jgi:hypothetical protein